MARINRIDLVETPLDSTFVSVESIGWRNPKRISLRNLAGNIEIGLNEEALADRNLTNVIIDEQEKNPSAPPGCAVQRSYIAIDENYLYVWVGNRWKRTILSEWGD